MITMEIIAFSSVFLLLIILFAIVRLQPRGKHVSISEHAAMTSWTYWIFGISLSLFGGIFLFFLQTSFSASVEMPMYLSFMYPFIWICLLGTAWVPDTGNGKLSKTHKIVAFSLAGWMVIIISSLPFSGHIPLFLKFIAAIISLWYIYTLYLFAFVKKSLQNFLVYQTINTVSFFMIIAAISVFQ